MNAPVSEGFVDFRGYGTWYQVAGELGSGTIPLLALHGGPGSTHNYFGPLEGLAAQGRAYRAFAKANPNGYALMFDPRASQTAEGAAVRGAALAPCLPGFVALVGEDKALAAARVLTPFLHGFVSMELSQAFRLGGGIDAAFETGLDAILSGLLTWRRSP